MINFETLHLKFNALEFSRVLFYLTQHFYSQQLPGKNYQSLHFFHKEEKKKEKISSMYT